jgi:predicted amidohydrolase YtcJ
VTALALVGGDVRHGADFTLLRGGGVLIRDGVVTRIGPAAEIRALAGAATVVDTTGRLVQTGFIDTHFHVMATGMRHAGVDVEHCTRIAEVLELIREAARDEGSWVLVSGLDEGRLAEGRAVTAAELDRVHDGPVFVNDRGLHYAVVNTAARRALGVTDPAGTGRLQEGVSGEARRALGALLPEELRRAAITGGLTAAARRGTTGVHAIEGGDLFYDGDAALLRSMAGELPITAVLHWSTDRLAEVAAAGLRRAGGDICVDGSVGSRTAKFSTGYADGPGDGRFARTGAEVVRLVEQAEELGLQLGFHVIGDAAIDRALTAFEQVLGGTPSPLRHRLDHFGFPTPVQVDRAAALGLAIPTQPAFALLRGGPGDIYEQRLGPDRARRGYPTASLLRAGLLVAGGSDSDVTPADPLLGVHAAVNHPNPAERIGVLDALRLFTRNGALLTGDGATRGVLAEGRAADCVVLGRDPVTTPPGELKDIDVHLTTSDGRIVHSTGRTSNP